MNIPNILSLCRLALLPVFMLVFSHVPKNGGLWAVAILAVSGLTDVLDGYFARKLKQVTRLGVFLDPLADKLTQAAVSFCVSMRYPEYLVIFGLIILKELAMLAGALKIASYGDGIEPARWYGKLYTFIFYMLMMILLAFPSLEMNTRGILFFIMLAAILFATAMYLPLFFKLRKERQKHENQ